MKKFLALGTLSAVAFVFVACGGIEINFVRDVQANAGGGGAANDCACQSPDGTRLKATYIVGDDGSRIQSPKWFDTEFNDDCFFQSLTNGETRCVPPATTLNSYIDSACTVPAWIVKNDCEYAAIPKYVKIEKLDYSSTCTKPAIGINYLAVDKGLPLNGASNHFSLNGDGACVAMGAINVAWKAYGTYPLHNASWFVKAEQGTGF